MTLSGCAVIFDLDGVLWNSTPHHDRAYRSALKKWGISRFDYSSISGMGTRAAMKRLLQDAGLPSGRDDVARISAEKSRLSSAFLRRRPPVRRSTVMMLRRLAKSHRLGLASSASRKTVGIFLSASGTRRLFGAVVTSDDVRRAKPFPDLYKRALRLLGVRASEAIVIEDAVSGIRAARAARIPVIGLTGTDSAKKLKAAGAVRVYRTLRDVERHVDGI